MVYHKFKLQQYKVLSKNTQSQNAESMYNSENSRSGKHL